MEERTAYKVVVAEDEPLILSNIVKKITNMNIGFTVVGMADDGKTALEMVDKHSPDVLVTDIRMPIMDGLDLLKIMSSKYPYVKLIVISGYDNFEYAQQALEHEVIGYLLKPLKAKELFDAFSRIRISLDSQRKTIKNNIMNIKGSHTYSPKEITHLVEVYIKENYSQEISFDLIAKNFNFSSNYLSKIFTKYIGENPSKYLISLRINHAKYLLLNIKELSIKEIGELVGYPNQFYFSRIFKSVVGKSPASYRDEN